MMPFDDNTMMIMLGLPDAPELEHRTVEEGPMEGMDTESDKLLKKIYEMIGCYLDGKCCDTEADVTDEEEE